MRSRGAVDINILLSVLVEETVLLPYASAYEVALGIGYLRERRFLRAHFLRTVVVHRQTPMSGTRNAHLRRVQRLLRRFLRRCIRVSIFTPVIVITFQEQPHASAETCS